MRKRLTGSQPQGELLAAGGGKISFLQGAVSIVTHDPVGSPKPRCVWAALTGLSGLKKKKNHEIGRGAWADLGEVGWEVDEIIIYL